VSNFGLKRCCLFIVALLTVTYFVSVGHAQYLTGPVASGAGGAGRASAEDGENLWLNPAALVHGSPFSSSLFYSEGYTAKQQRDKWWGVSLSDNSEDVFFAGGFIYVNRTRTFEALPDIDEQYYQVNLSRFLLRQISVGAAFFYQNSEVHGDKKYDHWDAHLGAMWNPTAELGLGLVFYNVRPRNIELPTILQNYDRVSVGGLYIIKKFFRIRGDLTQQVELNPDRKMQYQLGFESKLVDFIIARVGLDKDELSGSKFYTAGLTFDGPRAKFDYYYKDNQDSGGGAMHGVDMRLPFW